MGAKMKTGVVLFHANALDIYKSEWIQQCIDSIRNQTYQDFTVYEIDYSYNYRHENQLWDNSHFYYIPMKNNGYAQNFIIDRAFEDGCERVFVVNIDDYYHHERFEKQLQYDCDIVSSDFVYIQGGETTGLMIMSNKDIQSSFDSGLNIIANPVVCMSRRFWSVNKYNPETVPQEDFDLWKRALKMGFTFKIIPEILLYYRIHEKQISNQ